MNLIAVALANQEASDYLYLLGYKVSKAKRCLPGGVYCLEHHLPNEMFSEHCFLNYGPSKGMQALPYPKSAVAILEVTSDESTMDHFRLRSHAVVLPTHQLFTAHSLVGDTGAPDLFFPDTLISDQHHAERPEGGTFCAPKNAAFYKALAEAMDLLKVEHRWGEAGS